MGKLVFVSFVVLAWCRGRKGRRQQIVAADFIGKATFGSIVGRGLVAGHQGVLVVSFVMEVK